MNQAIEQAIIDQTNLVWEQGLRVGIAQERDRVLAMLSHEVWHHIGLNENGNAEHRVGCMACKQMELIKGEK